MRVNRFRNQQQKHKLVGNFKMEPLFVITFCLLNPWWFHKTMFTNPESSPAVPSWWYTRILLLIRIIPQQVCFFEGGCVSCERHTAVLPRKSNGRRRKRTLPLPNIRWVVIREPQRELIIQTVGTTISAHMQARCQFLRHRADTSIS